MFGKMSEKFKEGFGKGMKGNTDIKEAARAAGGAAYIGYGLVSLVQLGVSSGIGVVGAIASATAVTDAVFDAVAPKTANPGTNKRVDEANARIDELEKEVNVLKKKCGMPTPENEQEGQFTENK